MGIRVNWAASTELDIASYNLERADNLTGATWAVLVNVPHVIPGPAWDALTSTFFYLDSTGDTSKYYRLTAIDTVGQYSVPSTPFQAVSTAPSFPNVVKVDHNYGSSGALRYQTAGGIPVEAAVIRVWKKSDFDAGNTDAPLAITMTNAEGNWVNPLSLTTGFTYTVQFFKEGLYGPDKTEIVV
jgi:hypothetical protein